MTEESDLRLSIAALEDALALERRRLRQCEAGREQAVAAERERCAKMVVEWYGPKAGQLAAAIRKGE